MDNDRDDHPDGPDSVFYRYDELNRLIQIKDNDRDIKDLSYDGRGNLTKIQSFEHDDDQDGEDGDDGENDETDGHLFSQFTFDAANRLINAVNKHGDKTSYAYNGFGQRVQTIIDLEHGSDNGNRPEKDKDNGQGNDKDNPGNHNGWENGLPPGLANKPG